MVTSPSNSIVNLDARSPDLTQTTGASLSVTPTDVTNTSLDLSTSIGLLDDKAHEISSSIIPYGANV